MVDDDTTNGLVTTMAGLPQQVGRKLGPTAWRAVTQDMVDQFADLTSDHNYIHVDPVRARESPFGGTIAHGFLTLSFVGPVSQELVVISDAKTSLNYGLNKVRFPAPFRVGADFRGRGEIIEVTPLDGGVQLSASFTIEARGSLKPVLVAECLLRYYS